MEHTLEDDRMAQHVWQHDLDRTCFEEKKKREWIWEEMREGKSNDPFSEVGVIVDPPH